MFTYEYVSQSKKNLAINLILSSVKFLITYALIFASAFLLMLFL